MARPQKENCDLVSDHSSLGLLAIFNKHTSDCHCNEEENSLSFSLNYIKYNQDETNRLLKKPHFYFFLLKSIHIRVLNERMVSMKVQLIYSMH